MATISEDYVSFETAKLLKEKGFPQSTFRCHYIIDGNVHYKSFENRCGFGDYDIIAPTLQMAMKWLVQEYKLYVNVVPSVEGYYWAEKWHSYVENLNKRYPFGTFISTFNSREEACEAAIKYCLEKLI